MMERTFYNEAQLREFAAEFGRGLKAGDVVGLPVPWVRAKRPS